MIGDRNEAFLVHAKNGGLNALVRTHKFIKTPSSRFFLLRDQSCVLEKMIQEKTKDNNSFYFLLTFATSRLSIGVLFMNDFADSLEA